MAGRNKQRPLGTGRRRLFVQGGGLTSCRIGIGGLLGMIADVMAAGDWVEADARGLIQTGRRRDK